jgi:hypothetical protein
MHPDAIPIPKFGPSSIDMKYKAALFKKELEKYSSLGKLIKNREGGLH